MRRLLLLLVLVVSGPALVHAQTPTDILSACLADNTSGRDRKDLARWVFFSMAAHPEMRPFASEAVAAAREDTDKAMAGMFTRLLVDACPGETQAAVRESGGKAIETAFEALGGLAMQELMSNPEVGTSMSAFEGYLDQARFFKLLGG